MLVSLHASGYITARLLIRLSAVNRCQVYDFYSSAKSRGSDNQVSTLRLHNFRNCSLSGFMHLLIAAQMESTVPRVPTILPSTGWFDWYLSTNLLQHCCSGQRFDSSFGRRIARELEVAAAAIQTN